MNSTRLDMMESIGEIRSALLDLHSALIEAERSAYEQEIGPIQGPNHFLQLLTTDDWFEWLRPISHLVSHIDAQMESDEVSDAEFTADVTSQVAALRASLSEGTTGARYTHWLQTSVPVLIAHGRLAKAVKSLPAGSR